MLTLDEQRVRTFIFFDAHSNLDVLLLGYDDCNCTPMCRIYVPNRTPMATAHDDSVLILISVENTTHCYVDFGQTARTFICFGAHSNLYTRVPYTYIHATTLQWRRPTTTD